MEQVQNHLATWLKPSSSLNVPMGKSEHKMQTLLDLVLDLRVDNTRLQEENVYLRQMVQELEEQAQQMDGEVTRGTVKASSTSVEDTFDWEALYFDTRPSMSTKRKHQEPVQSKGNGTNGHGQRSPQQAPTAVDEFPPPPPPEPKQEPQPTPPTAVDAMTIEQLMSEMIASEPEPEPEREPEPKPEPATAKGDAHKQPDKRDLLAGFFHFEPPAEPAEAAPQTPAEPEVMTQPAFDAILRDPVTGRRLAEVLLAGSLISSQDVAGNQRRVWGFQLLQGDVKSEWRRGKHLYLCLKNGTAVRVRVAGLPADEAQNGYVELV